MRPAVGGLNTTGVAPYQMKADRSVEEVDWVLGIGGIEVKTGVSVGESVSLEDLEKKHDAVFVGSRRTCTIQTRPSGDSGTTTAAGGRSTMKPYRARFRTRKNPKSCPRAIER